MTLTHAANAGRHALRDRGADLYETAVTQAVRRLLAPGRGDSPAGPRGAGTRLRTSAHIRRVRTLIALPAIRCWSVSDLVDYAAIAGQDQSGIDFLPKTRSAPYFIGSIVTESGPFKAADQWRAGRRWCSTGACSVLARACREPKRLSAKSLSNGLAPRRVQFSASACR